MADILGGQLLQVQLHEHVFGRVAARQLHVMGQQLDLQLVFGQHGRVVQVLRHVVVWMEGQQPGESYRRRGGRGQAGYATANQRLLTAKQGRGNRA